MKDCFRIIVFILEHLLHHDKPLFGKLTKIEIFVSDGIRRCEIDWDVKNGPRYFNGQ